MSKILKSWSKMRKYHEKEMLADSINGEPEWVRKVFEFKMRSQLEAGNINE